ncbi:MAG: dockerin type I domain-containing protein [Pirellulales bacterium]
MKPFRFIGRVSAIAAVAILLAATWLAANVAVASHPDVLRNYRFIPSRSTLELTGGFAGFDETFHAFGTFGLVTGYEEGFSCLAIGCPPPPTHIPFADFVDVQSRLVPVGPLFDEQDLDGTLNLSGLHGTFTTPNRLHFHGVDGQGAPFRLEATLAGRLIHLVGANDPPCCDFFNYRFDAYAHLAPFADFNFDGNVDSADYTAWRDHLGTTSDATLEQGDADGDGDVDAADYAVWRQDQGTAIDMTAFAEVGGAALAAVPEPASFLLLAGGALMLVVKPLRLNRRAG